MIGSGADADVGGINRIRFTVLDRPTVPVVWLDTFAVANFAAGIAGKGQEAAVHALHYRRLVELVRADALVCLETDQLVATRQAIVARFVGPRPGHVGKPLRRHSSRDRGLPRTGCDARQPRRFELCGAAVERGDRSGDDREGCALCLPSDCAR